MWILVVFMMMQTPDGPAMQAGALPGSYRTLEECQQAQRELVRDHGDPELGVGFGCVRAERRARDA